MSNTQFRIHPAIGIARVGNSKDYYLGPESMAGMPMDDGSGLTGGLPIDPDTDKTITSADLRDDDGKLKRQAARFKIFDYTGSANTYPSGEGRELKIGDPVFFDGKSRTVKNIFWTVHLANKKANTWVEPEQGLDAFTPTSECPNRSPIIRNSKFGASPNDPQPNSCGSVGSDEPKDKLCCNATEVLGNPNRLRKLVIDAGPQSVGYDMSADFSRNAQNTYFNNSNNQIETVDYAQIFPSYPEQADVNIDTLGSIQTDSEGRLIVLGGMGKATGFNNENAKYDPDVELNADVNNDGWFDDTADGPVTATIQFLDGTFAEVGGNAWVVTTDPSYAPQIRNVVSLWDDVYNTWIENFNLEGNIYDLNKWPNSSGDKYSNGTGYNPDYKPNFANQVQPILEAADLQRWAVNLNSTGENAHDVISESTVNNPTRTDLLDFVRNPNDADPNNTPQNSTRMPLSLGDSEQNFLALSRTQFFFMNQWMNGKATESARNLGDGELLDRDILGNCLGGRFSPGIEMTFIVRDPNLYEGWNFSAQKGEVPVTGPFRIKMQKMDYSKTLPSPVLGVGYVPQRNNAGVEPGDICKFMSIPWHTDYNSCATHQADEKSNMTYWSWPAQRPVAVYTYEDLACYGDLNFQRFSLRGDGTASSNDASPKPMASVGRYQDRKKFLSEWENVGFVIQAPAISDVDIDKSALPAADVMKNYYLEVESKFKKDESNLVVEGPVAANAYTAPPHGGCPHAAAAMKNKSE